MGYEYQPILVFATTDLTKSAREIVKTYELRPEIEEDYRQLKDFWQIEDFKSTQYNVICFHIVCVLFGYLFFQLYTMLPEGAQLLVAHFLLFSKAILHGHSEVLSCMSDVVSAFLVWWR